MTPNMFFELALEWVLVVGVVVAFAVLVAGVIRNLYISMFKS